MFPPGQWKEASVPFSSEQAQRAWDAGAEAWDEFVESGADVYRVEVHGPALLEACGDVGELRVLDLGCGQGWFSRQLARRDARVVGVDFSPAMLARARQHEQVGPLGIEYVELDATRAPRQWPAASFDLVTACMSIQDMADPQQAIQGVSQILSQGGRLVFSVPHPFSEMTHREWERDDEGNKVSLKVDGYFEEGTDTLQWHIPRLGDSWETPRWRLTLSGWIGLVQAAGLVIAGLREPRPTADQVARRPELEDCRRLPYFLIIEAVQEETPKH